MLSITSPSETAPSNYAQRIKQQGGEASAFYADVRLEADVERMIQAIEETYQQIDIAVINATGPQPFLTIEEQTWERYLDQLEFFVKSPLLILQQVVAGMKSRGFRKDHPNRKRSLRDSATRCSPIM